MLVVDTHVHVWEPPSDKYPFNPIGRLRPDFYWPAEQQIGAMAGAGVDGGIIVQTSWYGYDNSYGLDCLARYPGRFGFVGMVDPLRPDLAGEVKRLAALGMSGLRLPALMRPDLPWWDTPETEQLWRLAGELDLILCLLITPQQAVDVAPVVERHEGVRVVFDHLAHPDLEQPPGDRCFRELLRMARFPNLYVKASAFPAISAAGAPYADVAEWVRATFDAFGPRRVMWGTDHAMTQRLVPFSLEEALAFVDQALPGASAEERAWVKGGAAAALWRLGEAK